MFGDHDVAKPRDRDVLRYPHALREQGFGAADGDHVVHRLDGRGVGRFVEHLQRGFRAILNRAAGLKDEPVVHLHVGFAQRAAIAFQAFLRPWRGGRPGEVGDVFVAELQQMLRDGVAADQFLDFHAHERFAKRRGRPEQNGRRLACKQFLIDAGLRVHAIYRRDEQTVHAARQEPPDAGFLAFRQVLGVGEQEVVAQFVRPLFEGEKHPRENRVGDGRDGDAEQLRRARAQPLRG